jgi:UPF0755 protein
MKKLGLGFSFLLLIAAGVGVFLWWRDQQLTRYAARPFGSEDSKLVEIPPGTGPRNLASVLAQAQVVDQPELLYRYLRREKLGPRLKAGEYEFKGALTPAQVLEKIASGQVKIYRFTVPEGLRVEQILPILAQSELHLSLAKLEALSGNPSFVHKLGVPGATLEGFLCPDTYSFTRHATEEAVLEKMVARGLEEYRKADAQRKSGIDLDLGRTITLASIIEKETGAPEERPRVSCVFHNRLRLGMKLGTDPTVLYAIRLIRGYWVNNITAKDLLVEHPYNTYTVKGLPPGPIANPGAASIQAALHPIECSDLYFVSRNDGTHVFCPDLKCHNEAVDKWQKQYWRQKNAEASAKAGHQRRR